MPTSSAQGCVYSESSKGDRQMGGRKCRRHPWRSEMNLEVLVGAKGGLIRPIRLPLVRF